MTSFPTGLTPTEVAARLLISHEYQNGSSEDIAVARINKSSGEGFVSKATVHQWFQRFNSGDFSLEDVGPLQGDTRKRTAGEDLCTLGEKRQHKLTTEISFWAIDELLLKQVVRKFTFRAGVRFYRSCRGAKELVNDTKPVWDLEYLDYSLGERTVTRDWKPESRITSKFAAEKFCGVRKVSILLCEPVFFKEVVMPEIEALGAVRMLNLHQALSTDEMRLLLAAAKPYALEITERNSLPSDVFENVKKLVVTSTDLLTYRTTNKVFELARNRKTLELYFPGFHKEIITTFLNKWQSGESTSSLEKLTLGMSLLHNCVIADARAKAKEIQKMLESFVKTSNGYIVHRRGGDQLRMRLNLNWNSYILRVECHFT